MVKAVMTQSTSQIAGQRAALKATGWRLRILDRLRAQPSALWELGAFFKVPDHTISGRITELARDQWIERTGERRVKPESKCPADVWRVRSAGSSTPDLASAMGYPHTLVIQGDPYDRQDLLPAESYPGIPYGRRTDMGGLRLIVRLALIEFPQCGRPLMQSAPLAAEGKIYRCGADCGSWKLRLVNEAGRAPMLALEWE